MPAKGHPSPQTFCTIGLDIKIGQCANDALSGTWNLLQREIGFQAQYVMKPTIAIILHNTLGFRGGMDRAFVLSKPAIDRR
jgi:hypothetical protein